MGEVLIRGAIGMISTVPRQTPDISSVVPLPASLFLPGDLKLVQNYINSTKFDHSILDPLLYGHISSALHNILLFM